MLAFVGLVLLGFCNRIWAQSSISGSSITIVGEDRDSKKSSGSLSVSLPSNIQPGDVSFLFLGQSDATNLSAPSNWTLIQARGPADINQEARYRVYQSGQSTTLNFNSQKNAFVYVVTLRGVSNSNPIRASWSGKDTHRGGESTCSSGHRGRARTTQDLSSASNGVRLLSCAFDDPFIGEVFTSSSYSTRTMTVLEAWKDGDDGLMVAIEGTNGNNTSDRYIQGVNCASGGGNDIVISFTVNPSGSTPPPNSNDVIIDLCESTSGWNNSSANSLVLSGTRKEGSHSIKSIGSGTDDFKKVFSPTINGSGKTTLEFWYYVSSVSLMQSADQVEIGSAGQPDDDEYHWGISRSTLQTGWNKMELPISSAGTSGGAPNMGQLNWFRLYRRKNGSITSRIDDIRLTDGSNKTSADNYVTEHIEHFKVFPNPARNSFKVYLSHPEDPVQIQVMDMQGRIVMSAQSNTEVQEFDVSELGKGLYMIRLANQSASETVRLIVE